MAFLQQLGEISDIPQGHGSEELLSPTIKKQRADILKIFNKWYYAPIHKLCTYTQSCMRVRTSQITNKWQYLSLLGQGCVLDPLGHCCWYCQRYSIPFHPQLSDIGHLDQDFTLWGKVSNTHGKYILEQNQSCNTWHMYWVFLLFVTCRSYQYKQAMNEFFFLWNADI